MKHWYWWKFCLENGLHAIKNGLSNTSKSFHVGLKFAKYWAKKLTDRNHHWNNHGGKRYLSIFSSVNICYRHQKFSDAEKRLIQIILWHYVNDNPTHNIADYVRILDQHHLSCSREFIRQIFKKWRWSWKIPNYFQLNKYTTKNIEYYGDYIYWIRQEDLRRIKFMDEVHFVARGKI